MKLTKKGRINLISVLSYSQVFKQPPPAQPFDLLRAYPTDLLLLRLSKLNSILYLEQDTDIQNVRGLKEVVFQDVPTSDAMLMEFSLILNRAHQGAFSAPVMSLIIKDALENFQPLMPEVNVNPAGFAYNFFKAILAYNEHYYSGAPQIDTFEGLFASDMQQQYYLRRERYLKLDMLMKFGFISKFLSVDDKLKRPALEYCQALQIGTVWGLAQFFLFLFSRLITREKIANHILDRSGVDWPIIQQFIMYKADISAGRKLSLLKDIVPKPLYEYDSNRLIVLDYNYFTYGMDQGVLYSIYGKSSLCDGQVFKNYNNYKAYIGLQYFEQHYVGGFLRHIFSKWNHTIVSTEKYQDFIIRAGNDVFIVEVKMTDFNVNGLEHESFADFRSFIDENFLNFKQGKQGKNKGLAQVIRQIGYLRSDIELHGQLDISDITKMTIYPIMIYSDANLDMNGVNEYINEKATGHLSTFASAFQKIQPIVMINGTFFMNYYRHLRKKPAVFAEWLDAYIKSVQSMKKRYETDKDPRQYLIYNKSLAEHMRRKLPDEEIGLNLDYIEEDFELDVTDFGKDMA